MQGPIQEGFYKDANGWWKVEERHYPTRRWVIRPARLRPMGSLEGPGHMVVGTDTPALTPERWAELEGWL